MRKIVTCVLAAVLLSASLICIFSSQINQNCKINNEETVDFSQSWSLYIDGSLEETDFDLPEKVSASKNVPVEIRKTLPEIFPDGMTIAFRSSQQYVEVKADGEILYTYGYDRSSMFGKAPGSLWNFVRIPEAFAGKVISITFTSPYSSYSGTLPQINYGSKTANIFKISGIYFFAVVVSVLFAISTIALLLTHFLTAPDKKRGPLLSLGIFALLSCLWTLSESKMLQFFISNQVLTLNIACISMMLMPIPFFIFSKQAYNEISAKLVNGLCLAHIITFSAILFLQMINVYDFIDTLAIFHVVLIVTSTVFFLHAIRTAKNHPTKELKFFRSTLILLMFSIVLDMANFYLRIITDAAFFFRVGLLTFIVILTVSIINKIYHMMMENVSAAVLEKLAYTDILTDTKNRTCYEKDLERYGEIMEHNKFCVIIFDINNLKIVNDTFGHTAGDKLIKACCECIKQTFGSRMELYRIGGDEFVLLGDSHESTIIEKYADKFVESSKTLELTFPAVPSVAYGIAIYDSEIDDSIENVCKRADAAMYRKKQQMKSDS